MAQEGSGPEQWREEPAEVKRFRRLSIVLWVGVFALVFSGAGFLLWWAASVVSFAASRVKGVTKPTYRVFGVVRDARTGAPVPWAEVADAPSDRPPLFHTTANLKGEYEYLTIAEPHTVWVSALGYRRREVQAGPAWFLWMPRGEQRLDVELEPER